MAVWMFCCAVMALGADLAFSTAMTKETLQQIGLPAFIGYELALLLARAVSMTLSFFVPACISILLASHVATKRPIFVTINAPFFLDSLKGCFIGLFVPLTLYFMVTTPLTIMVDMKREAMEPSTVCGLLLTLLVFIKGSIASVFSAVCTLQCLAHITTGDRPSSGRAFRLMFSHKGAYIATLFLLVSALVSLIDLPLDMVTPVFASIGSYMVLILFCNRA